MHALIPGIMLFSAAVGRADLILDTDPGSAVHGGLSLFKEPAPSINYQWLAGKFTLSQTTKITSVEGWIGTSVGGGAMVSIADAISTIPGSNLYSDTFTTDLNLDGRWLGVESENWLLGPGTYWAVFSTLDGGMHSYMPGGAAHPLEQYAFNNSGNGRWIAQDGLSALGVRISGDTAVPEPSTFGLLGAAGLVTLVVMRRRSPSSTRS